jgi:hypothetical protein
VLEVREKQKCLDGGVERRAIPKKSSQREYGKLRARSGFRTSPRKTWVIPISLSSTTDARWYVGNMSVLSRTGSVASDACASLGRPKIRSVAIGSEKVVAFWMVKTYFKIFMKSRKERIITNVEPHNMLLSSLHFSSNFFFS